VISVPSFLSAPSGETYVTGAWSDGSTRLSTNSAKRSPAPSTSCGRVWTGCGKPSSAGVS